MAKKAQAMTTTGGFDLTDERPDYINTESVRGSEGVGMDDLAIPRLDIIQDLSPQRKRDKPEYIEGAEEGMVFNTVSQALYGDSVTIVPVFFRKEWVIWKDRDSGGGFRGAYSSPDEAEAERGQLEDGDQCEVIDTAQHFCLVLTDERVEEAVISMAKSKMRASRSLNSMIRMVGGDRWARAFEMKAVNVKGAKGEFYNWQPKALGYVPKELYDKAESLYEAIASGQRDVDRRAAGADATEEASDDEY